MENLEDKLKIYIQETFKKIHLRKVALGLEEDNFDYSKEADDAYKRVLDFIEDNNEVCDIWHSKECQEDRNNEHKYYGKVRVYKVKCIDGRKPRGFEGEADSLKTEEALIALDMVRSTGEIIPRQVEICSVLSDPTIEPLEISIGHYDSHDTTHGCAAMKLTLDDPDEDVWKYLSDREKVLVYKARTKGNHIANVVLLELANIRAFTNFHNKIRIEAGEKPLARVGIAGLFDTRTMGLEFYAPLVVKDKEGNLTLKDSETTPFLSTTVVSKKLMDLKNKNLPAFGKYKDVFFKRGSFKEYSRVLTDLTGLLFETKDEEILQVTQEITDFLQAYYFDLTEEQSRALRYRILRSVAHQYLTGLSEYTKYHPFSGHEERYASVSQDADYPGKYILDYQTFRMSCPDEKTGAKRMEIASSVMDSTGVDGNKPHIFFISTAANKGIFEKKDAKHEEDYQAVLSRNLDLFRVLIDDARIRNRIDKGNILPVAVIVSYGKVVDVVSQAPLYL